MYSLSEYLRVMVASAQGITAGAKTGSQDSWFCHLLFPLCNTDSFKVWQLAHHYVFQSQVFHVRDYKALEQ